MAVDPERSNGVPLNPHFRNPPPGALDPQTYTDPVTLPAGDIADNPYWKRDVRRNHPQLSVLAQQDVAALLTLGSAARAKVELIGEAGSRALAATTTEGSLTTALAKLGVDALRKEDVLFVDGLPPTPSGQSLKTGEWNVHEYELIEDADQSFPVGEYVVCRLSSVVCCLARYDFMIGMMLIRVQVPMQVVCMIGA